MLFTAIILFCAFPFSSEAEVRATLGVTKVLDIRIGAEVETAGRWGIKSSFGYSFLGSPPEELYFSYDLMGFFTFTGADAIFVCRGLFGIIDGAVITLNPPVVAFAPGVSAFAGFRLGSRFEIGLRGGVGVLLQLENYRFNSDFPWPDIAFELHFRF